MRKSRQEHEEKREESLKNKKPAFFEALMNELDDQEEKSE